LTDVEEMWRKTGSAGGKKRMSQLTKAERSELGRKAVQARWKKAKAAKAKAKKAAKPK
jgi:hypothetical protein